MHLSSVHEPSIKLDSKELVESRKHDNLSLQTNIIISVPRREWKAFFNRGVQAISHEAAKDLSFGSSSFQ